MIVSHGKFVIKPEQIDRAQALMAEMVEHSIQEPGCISYDYYISMHKPNVIMLFQEWDSIDAVNEHFATPHMHEFLEALPELLESEVVTHRYAIQDEEHHEDAFGQFKDAESLGEIEFEVEDEAVTLH